MNETSENWNQLETMHRHHMQRVQRALDAWGDDCMLHKVNPIDGYIQTQLGGKVAVQWECNLDSRYLTPIACKHCGQNIGPDQTCPELDGYKACEPEEAPRKVRL